MLTRLKLDRTILPQVNIQVTSKVLRPIEGKIDWPLYERIFVEVRMRIQDKLREEAKE